MCQSLRGKRQKLLYVELNCRVIQENPECTAFLFWSNSITATFCSLYKYGISYDSPSPTYISGLCPKAGEIKEQWQSDGFYCDMTGIA